MIKRSIIFMVLVLFLVACSTQKQLNSNFIYLDFTKLTVNEFITKVSETIEKKIVFSEKLDAKLNYLSTIKVVQKNELLPLLNKILNNNEMTLISMG